MFFWLLLALAVAAATVAVARHRRASVLRTALVALAASAGAWVAAVGIEATGWQDTDGWIDCQPNCDGWHSFGAVLFWAPLVFAAVFLAVVLVAAIARVAAKGP